MSYILDALRRADSERGRGAVPGIHSPPPPPTDDDPKPRQSGQSHVLVGVIVVLLLALAGLLAWQWMGGKPPAPVVAQTTPVTQPAPEPLPEPMVPAAPAMAPVTEQPAAPVPAPAPPPQQPQAPMAAAPVLSVPPRTAPASRAPATTTPPAPAPTAEADTRIYTLGELPANIQRELPKLVIGGAMYSETPANRMLIINSQVFHEGDKLTPDLLLQEIRLKSAVLKYKGYRYGVSY